MRLIAIILILVPATLFSINNQVDNTSIYNMAMGGPHSGMAKGFGTFYNNPALLAEYDTELNFFEIGVNLKGDALDIANLYLGDSLTLDDPAALITTLQDESLTSLLIGVDIPGPIFVGRINNNWGWAVKNITSLNVDVPGLLLDSNIIAREDLMFAIGIAFPFDFKLGESFNLGFTPGVMSRSTIRAEVEVDSDLLGILSYMDDFASILDTYPLTISPIFALDFGFTLNFNNIISLSGVVKDVYTPILKYPVADIDDAMDIFTTTTETTGNTIEREINFGLASDIPLGPIELIVSDLDIYLDYFDLLDFDTNFWLHWGIGTDIELLNKFHLLAGLNEGLLSLGVNIDISGLEVGFAMYGTEEGLEPGVASTFNFLFSLKISF
ncbi:MAG: hypothetical protein OCD02_22700 [Spirochaetaceae bacterium]